MFVFINVFFFILGSAAARIKRPYKYILNVGNKKKGSVVLINDLIDEKVLIVLEITAILILSYESFFCILALLTGHDFTYIRYVLRVELGKGLNGTLLTYVAEPISAMVIPLITTEFFLKKKNVPIIVLGIILVFLRFLTDGGRMIFFDVLVSNVVVFLLLRQRRKRKFSKKTKWIIFGVIVCMFLLVRQEGDTTVYGLLTVLASVGSNIFNLFHAHRYIKMKPVGGLNFKRHFKPILVFFFMSVATTIYTNLDNVMLGFMKNDEEVGYYNAAIKIKSALVSLVASLGTVLLPRASYYIKNNQIDGFNAIARKAIHFTLLISFPLTVYFCEFSRDCILLLSGSQYLPAIAPMIIIMPTIIFIGLTNIIGLQIFIPLGMEKLVLFSVLGGAVVDFIINYFLIPLFSSSGAAIGTLVAEFVVLIIQYFGGHENTEGLFKGISFWKIMVSLLASAAVSYGISYLKLGSFLILLASAAVFFAVYTILLLALKESMVCILFNDFFHKLKGN